MFDCVRDIKEGEELSQPHPQEMLGTIETLDSIQAQLHILSWDFSQGNISSQVLLKRSKGTDILLL